MNRARRSMRNWAKHPNFVAMLESHDTPRFTSRANVSGEEAISLLFSCDARIVCLYQGEELGLENPQLSDNIEDYGDIQTIMRYEKAVAAGEDPKEALLKLKPESRENARVPIDLDEYERQMNAPKSCWQVTRDCIQSWREDNLER